MKYARKPLVTTTPGDDQPETPCAGAVQKFSTEIRTKWTDPLDGSIRAPENKSRPAPALQRRTGPNPPSLDTTEEQASMSIAPSTPHVRSKGLLAHYSVERAQELACMVRDEGRDAIGAFLDRLDRQALYGLTVALAAMVPIDQPAHELMAWIDETWDEEAA